MTLTAQSSTTSAREARFVDRARQQHGNRYAYHLVNYAGCHTPVVIVCSEHGAFECTPSKHLSGSGCRDCRSAEDTIERKDAFIKKARSVHGTRYDYSDCVYKDAHAPVTLGCERHGPFEITPTSHLSGRGCIPCGKERAAASRRTSGVEFVQRARAIHGTRYDYSTSSYTGANDYVEILCVEHGSFLQRASNHLAGRGCRDCARQTRDASKGWTHARFLECAVKVHGSRYDYSRSEYRGALKNVVIGCRVHGLFEQTPANHLRGRGCRDCGVVRASRLRRISNDDFLARALAVHGDRYRYDDVILTTVDSPVAIDCPKHGTYRQTPNAHLAGQGCARCASADTGRRRRLSQSEFLRRVQLKHGSRYGYSETLYETAWDEISVSCPDHGPFVLVALAHLKGQGCPLDQGSSHERLIAQLLTDLSIDFRREWTTKELRSSRGGSLRFDFAILSQKIVIEFDGPHHHRPVRYRGMGAEAAETAFLRTVENDAAKNRWAKDKGWALVRLTEEDDFRAAVAALLSREEEQQG